MRVIQIGRCDSKSEKEFVDELKGWNDSYQISGVAFVGLNIPVKIDALIVTPKGCTVVEVKGVTAEASGRVEVPPNGSWTSENGPLPLRLHGGAANPIDQVNGYIWEVKGKLEKELPGAFINGLILLVQHHDLVRNQSNDKVIHTDPDIVVYGEGANGIAATTLTRFRQNKPLRKYFHRQLQAEGRKNRDWDIESVETLFQVLGLTDAPTREELDNEGFRPRSKVEASVSLPPKKKPVPAGGRPTPDAFRSTRLSTPQKTASSALSSSSPEDATSSAATGTPPARAETPQLGRNSESAPTARVPTTSLPTSPPLPPIPPPWRQQPPGVLSPTPVTHHRSHTRRVGRIVRMLRNAILAAVACCVLLAGFRVVKHVISDHGKPKDSPAQASSKIIRTASRNIVCTAEGQGVRCDINNVNYAVPPTPSQCRATPNWGHTFSLGPGAPGHLECPTERMTATSTTSDPLDIGQSVTFGSSVCTSQIKFLQCVNGEHGFRIARASYHAW